MTPVLALIEVSFSFGARNVLDAVSLSVDEGQCAALIGPNGGGKTTLLRLASGGLKPEVGQVMLRGRSLARLSKLERSRLVAIVPQQLDVPFAFTVQQIVEQGRSPYLGLFRGLDRNDRIAVDRALDMAHVSGLRNRIFNELSGGERQRVKIALGLAQESKFLLLDEPTQNLDIGRQVELIDLLHYLRDTGLTIFASTHDLHLVPNNFDTVHMLTPENRLRSGPPDVVLSVSNLTEAFGCSPGRHPLLQEDRSAWRSA